MIGTPFECGRSTAWGPVCRPHRVPERPPAATLSGPRLTATLHSLVRILNGTGWHLAASAEGLAVAAAVTERIGLPSQGQFPCGHRSSVQSDIVLGGAVWTKLSTQPRTKLPAVSGVTDPLTANATARLLWVVARLQLPDTPALDRLADFQGRPDLPQEGQSSFHSSIHSRLMPRLKLWESMGGFWLRLSPFNCWMGEALPPSWHPQTSVPTLVLTM